MDWEELKEEVKDIDETLATDRIDFGFLSFYKDGNIWSYGNGINHIAKNRTPDQKLAIMKALQWKYTVVIVVKKRIVKW